jgi:hypothetical protein
VVLFDVQIPEQGEFRFAARLYERFPDTAIILATGGDSIEPPVISLQPGVVVYLAMSFKLRGGAQGRPRWSPVSSDILSRPWEEGRPDRFNRDMATKEQR